MLKSFINKAILLVPDVIPHLSRGYFKTYDYMLNVIEKSVMAVYNGNMGGEFVDIMGNLITGQITQAFQAAWEDEGMTDAFAPPYLAQPLQDMIDQQSNFDYIYSFYKDIIDARVDGKPIDPLIARADLWANRYNEAYNYAIGLIEKENGGKLIWVEGDTEQKCNTCLSLDGIVAFAKEWDELGVRPQNAENNKLECGGWRCQCTLTPTDQRRSPNAYERIKAITG